MFFNLRFSIHFACHFPLTVWHWTKVEKLQSEIWPALFFYYAAAGQELPSQRKTLIASQKYQTLSQHLKRRQIHMTEFSSVIPFKKSPCCFASPRGPKSVVLQFVNDTVLKNWKQVKQVRYPSLRYQTIKQVGHLVIYTNLMSLVVACVAGGICFGDLAKRRLACVEFQFRFGANKDFGFGRSRNGTSTIFRTVFDSCSSFFAPKPRESACYADYEKIGIKSKDREKVTGIKSSLTGLQCRLPMQKSLVKIPPDTLVIMIAKDFSFSI